MTVRDFAYKYDLPLNQVKAALNIPRGDIMTIKERNAKMYSDYEEEWLLVQTTAYYLKDMRGCIERANNDNEALKRLSERYENE